MPPIIPQGNQIDIHASFKRGAKSWGALKADKVIVDFKADPLILDIATKETAAIIAQEMTGELVSQIQNIPQKAKPETVAKRESQVRQWARGGNATLRKQFSGGRMGPMPPTVSDKLMVNSGRLIKGIVLRPRMNTAGESVITMNVAQNRLDSTTFGGGEAGLEERVIAPLKRHVTLFADSGARVNQSPALQRALNKVAGLIVSNDRAKAIANRKELAKSLVDLARKASQLADSLAY